MSETAKHAYIPDEKNPACCVCGVLWVSHTPLDLPTDFDVVRDERDAALAKLAAIDALIQPHLLYQASERGALAREVARITGQWQSNWARTTDVRLLSGGA